MYLVWALNQAGGDFKSALCLYVPELHGENPPAEISTSGGVSPSLGETIRAKVRA